MSFASMSKYNEKNGRFVNLVKNQNISMKNLSIIIKIQVKYIGSGKSSHIRNK